MSGPGLLEALKEHALSLGYTLVAEDFRNGPDFLPADFFLVRDATGAAYSISVEDWAGPGG